MKAPTVDPVRKKDEKFETYKKRREREQKKMDEYLEGRLFWDSETRGPYFKKSS